MRQQLPQLSRNKSWFNLLLKTKYNIKTLDRQKATNTQNFTLEVVSEVMRKIIKIYKKKVEYEQKRKKWNKNSSDKKNLRLIQAHIY